VAIEVPDKDAKPPPGTDETMEDPGAKRERNEAEFENEETTSLFVVDPTLIALEIHAGSLIPLAALLPAATTVAMPAERRVSTIAFVGPLSVSHAAEEVCTPPPRLMFTAAMRYWFLRS
jgi:hypothetical protein